MKFEPLVKSQENELFRISDGAKLNLSDLNQVTFENAVSGSAAICAEKITVINLCWNNVEIAAESYNEEGLAALRDYLKKLEDAGAFAFIAVQAGKPLDDADKADSFIKAMVHTARRIKDATSVIGFSVASELMANDAGKALDANSWSQWFVNEMNVKHGHYVYFIQNQLLTQFNIDVKTAETPYILY